MNRPRYMLVMTPSAHAWVKKASRAVRQQIGFDLYQLQCDPNQPGVKALTSKHQPPLMRLRSGDYRVVYYVKDDVLVITVVGIADRKEVYQMIERLRLPKKLT